MSDLAVLFLLCPGERRGVADPIRPLPLTSAAAPAAEKL